VGKDTIIDALRARPGAPDHHYVVTCTTRGRRPGEIEGVSYHFLDRDRFLDLRDQGEMLEATEIYGNWYGTPRSEVREALAAGRDVILKIDVQGAQVVKERVEDALLIFIVPPSLETLFERLRSRATETADELELRQRSAAIELARQDDYDYVVVNETGQVDRTAARIDEIIAAEKQRRPDRRVVV
jgi:guanylate kinase